MIWLGLWAQLLICESIQGKDRGWTSRSFVGVIMSNQWVSSQCCVHLVKWNSMVVNQNTSKMRRKEAIKGTCLQEKTTVYRPYCKIWYRNPGRHHLSNYLPISSRKMNSMNKQVKPNFPITYKICGKSRSPATTNMQRKPRITRRKHVCWCDHKNSRNQGKHETATGFSFSFLSLGLSFFFDVFFLCFLSLSLSRAVSMMLAHWL